MGTHSGGVALSTVVVSAGLVLAACSHTAGPPPTRQELAREAAYSEVRGVRVLLRDDAWSGPAAVREHVSLLRVSISNDSGAPLRVCYREFALIGPDGSRHRALAPFQLELAADGPRVVSAAGPFLSRISATRFEVSAPYQPLYPGYRAVRDAAGPDPGEYASADAYWRQTAQPTREMVAQALPEGVLASGGRLAGYLYFERVPPGTAAVRFQAALVHAATGEELGTISIPFMTGE